MLGKRESKHVTVAAARNGYNESAADFRPGQKVQTVDGYPGKVVAVQDGPFRGNEAYQVVLDNGMGGGLYTSSQLKPINERTAEVHTAADDYPELGTILEDRPDIAPNQVLASKTASYEPDICPECEMKGYADPGCQTCGGTGSVGGPQQGGYDEWDAHHAPESMHGQIYSSLQTTALKRLFPCAYCQSNQMGTGNFGQHCSQCPNEVPFDLQAHGHTEEEHSKQQLLADIAQHLENCPQSQEAMQTGNSTPLNMEPSDMNAGNGEVTDCPACSQMETGGISDGSPGGWTASLNPGEMTQVFGERHLGPAIPPTVQTPQGPRRGTDFTRFPVKRDKSYGTHREVHKGPAEGCPHCVRQGGMDDDTYARSVKSKEFAHDTVNRLRDAIHEDAKERFPHSSALVTEASTDPDFRFHVTASWADVRNKAKQLRQSGRVRIVAASEGYINGEVLGEHHVYETELQRMPGSKAVAAWSCGCKWAAYSWGRSAPFKRFEGRMCSHALAMHFEAQARGMFGREITEDTERKPWLTPSDPVVVRWDRDKKRNDTRRANPPGNMNRIFQGSLLPDLVASLEGDDFSKAITLTAAGFRKEAWALIPELMGAGEAAGAAGEAAGAGAEVGSAGGGGASNFLKNQITQQFHPGNDDQQSHTPQGDTTPATPGGMDSDGQVDYTQPNQMHSMYMDTEKPALPSTTGDEDGLAEGIDPGGDMTSSLTPESEDDSRTASVSVPLTAEGQNLIASLQPSWLDPSREGGSSNNSDIAQAARAFLAKQATKDFSPGEQRMLIDEGQGVRASNLDRLDIEGTHYAQITDEDDESWLS